MLLAFSYLLEEKISYSKVSHSAIFSKKDFAIVSNLRFFYYRIRPNYRTVCLGFSKLQGTLGCGKIRIYLLKGVVGWCKGAVYLRSPGRPTDIGLQLGKACYPCSG